MNTERISEQVKRFVDVAMPKVIVLDFSREYAALKMLIEAEKRQRDLGISIWLAGLNPKVLATVQK